MMNNNKSIFRPEKWNNPIELCVAIGDYYDARKDAMRNSETISYCENGKEYSIKSVNFDTFVRVVKGQTVPVALDDAWGMEV